jgi:glycosyltransferase involved in cell wall biosynthesis
MNLPRLLYLGDVPVESSYHGSALIYRLLQNYPAEKLRIIEGNLRNSLPERRLAGVAYDAIKVGWKRPLYTRFSAWAHLGYSFAARWKVGAVEQALGDFKPEAVLTVAHEFLWLTAARYARKHSLPLHLICHDDWPRLALVPSAFRNWLEREFGQVYRQAASRLCVSPYMVEEYERRYGVGGKVLYPSRDINTPVFMAVEAVGDNRRPFTLAYAGSIDSRSNLSQLVVIANLLTELKAKLILFGPFDDKPLIKARMDLSNVIVGGMLSSAELVRKLHQEVDVMILPLGFEDVDAEEMAINFPSKLTDYTATGLPLLIWGSETNSAVKWAKSELGVAAVLTSPNQKDLVGLLAKLKQDYSWRNKLAATANLIGQRYFNPESARSEFWASLANL